jgi:hypothetical protein
VGAESIPILERSFPVAAPPERAWALLVRAEQWPQWAQHIRSLSLEPAGPLGPGSRGAIRLKNGIRSTFRVTLFEPGRRWEWVGPFLWLTVAYDHVVAPGEGGGSRVDFRLRASGFGAGTLGRIFARVYARDLDRAIPRLQALLA